MNPKDFKHCKHCDQVFPLSGFSKDLKQADGLGFYCRKCQSSVNSKSRKSPVTCPQCEYQFIVPVKHSIPNMPEPLNSEQQAAYFEKVKKDTNNDDGEDYG
jgi:DNA-directed RNA polymerase subunit RPC12/RpoP